MTRTGYQKWEIEIKAWAEGTEVYFYDDMSNNWVNIKDPDWLEHSIYVIKDKHFEARKAFALGKPIECRSKSTEWGQVMIPAWICDEYREMEESEITLHGYPIKVGDKVWKQPNKWCTVISIIPNSNYPIIVDGSFALNMNGKSMHGDRILYFWKEQHLDLGKDD